MPQKQLAFILLTPFLLPETYFCPVYTEKTFYQPIQLRPITE